MGLGGVLTWAGRILELAEALDRQIALRFSSATYQPSCPVADWLECYFIRRCPSLENAAIIPAQHLPIRRDARVAELAPRLWRYLEIRPDCVTAADAIPFATYAAVHYRGSDKYLEARRVTYDVVLRRTEQEMAARGLDKLFVASDEEAFVEAAARRFGNDCWWLPIVAVATNHRPPHFTEAPGETKATEALTTMTLLARSQMCVRTPSLMSEWAMTISGQRPVTVVSS
jgi:hypothetical protein